MDELTVLGEQRLRAYLRLLDDRNDMKRVHELRELTVRYRALEENGHPIETWTEFVMGLYKNTELRWVAKALVFGLPEDAPPLRVDSFGLWRAVSDSIRPPPRKVEPKDPKVLQDARLALGDTHPRVKMMEHTLLSAASVVH
jgi:hypothetical protein